MYRPISKVLSLNGIVLVAFESSDLQMFKFDQQKEDLCYIKCEPGFDHEKEVTCLEAFPEKNLFLSGGMDGFVKVWNVKKELIREIKFPEPVTSISFLNEHSDLIIGHLGKVSTVSHKDYKPNELLRLYAPSKEDLDFFYSRKLVLATEEVYYELKLKDDDAKKQNTLHAKP
jgi:WD40 repeat protein